MEPKVTKKQLELLRHTLGLNYEDVPYRNYFALYEDCDDFKDLEELVEIGLVIKRPSPINPDMILFHANDAGCQILGLSGLDAIKR